MNNKDVLWHDRKRNFLGLPWTFTVYELTKNRLFIQTGIFTTHEDEVRLYRITDLSLTRTLWQKIIGTGTIHVDSSDKTLQNFELRNIKDSENIKEQLSNLVEIQRRENHVYARESLDSVPDGHGSHDMHDGHDEHGDFDPVDPVDFNHDGIDDISGEHIG